MKRFNWGPSEARTSTFSLYHRIGVKPGFFFEHFSKTQQEKNSENSKTQPVFSSKLRIFSRKLNFSATLLSESEIKNSKNSTKLRIFSQNSVFRQIHLRPHPHKCSKKEPDLDPFLLWKNENFWILMKFESIMALVYGTKSWRHVNNKSSRILRRCSRWPRWAGTAPIITKPSQKASLDTILFTSYRFPTVTGQWGTELTETVTLKKSY